MKSSALRVQNSIDENAIDSDALTIIHRLKQAGYVAYLVGGCVRDLLCNQEPKDFDISTSAHPDAIKKLFGKQCLLIGRRFRLAHIRFGRKIFEVSTFRAFDSTKKLVLRDNRYGTPKEDALRRDFTVNGMFYDPSLEKLIDHVGGFKDLQQWILRPIGDAKVRFRQDPVRMLRLLKFKARFCFNIEQEVLDDLNMCKREIVKSAPARVLEEMLRMFESGYALSFVSILREHRFLELIFPWLSSFTDGQPLEEAFPLLSVVDQRNKTVKLPLDRSVILAAFLLPMLDFELKHLKEQQEEKINLGDVDQLMQALLRGVDSSSFPHFPHRILSEAGQITSLQYRLVPEPFIKMHRHHKVHKMVFIKKALSLLSLRTMLDHSLKPKLLHWTKLFTPETSQEC